MYRGDWHDNPYSGRISLVLQDCRLSSRLECAKWLVVCEENIFLDPKWICEGDWRWSMIPILDW